MEITKLISDLGFPIVISLITIYGINEKINTILTELREIKSLLEK